MAKARPANSNTDVARPGGDDRGPTTAANSKTRCDNADTDFLHRFFVLVEHAVLWTRHLVLGPSVVIGPWSAARCKRTRT